MNFQDGRTTRVMFLLFLLLLFPLCRPEPAAAADAALRVLTCEEPPLNYLENGQVTGIVTDIVREIMHRTGNGGKIVLLPWARAYQQALSQANVVLYTAGRTRQREALFHWVGPVIRKHWLLLAKAGSGPPIASLAELAGVRRIAVLRSDARAQLLRSRGLRNLLEVDSHQQAAMMVFLGRASLWASSDLEAPLVNAAAGIPAGAFAEAAHLATIHSYIVISKQTPPAVVRQWQHAYRQLVQDSTLANIAARWSRRLSLPLTVDHGLIAVSRARQPAQPLIRRP